MSDSKVYDPFGEAAAITGVSGITVGFQGDYTDPATNEVWMGARWYDPTGAQFRTRDTVFGELITPVSLNRCTYGWANPLTYWDPDGRFVTSGPLIDGVWGSATAFERQAATDKRTAKLRAEKKAVKAAAAYKAASSAARKGLDELREAARIANMRRSVEDQQLAEFATSVFALGGGGGFTSRGGGDFGCSPSTKAGCELDVWNEFSALMGDIEEFLNPVPATGPDGARFRSRSSTRRSEGDSQVQAPGLRSHRGLRRHPDWLALRTAALAPLLRTLASRFRALGGPASQVTPSTKSSIGA